MVSQQITVMVIVLVFLNWNYFLPKGGEMGPLTDEEKFRGVAWELQQNGGIYDYLPIYAKIAPNSPRETLAEIVKGEGEIKNMESGTNWAKFATDIEGADATIRINIFDFPDWKIFVDGKEVTKYIPEEEKSGRIWFGLSSGEHEVYARLYNTPIRKIANAITLVSFIGTIGFFVMSKKRRFSD